MDQQYRKLTAREIKIMEKAGCDCADWNRIEVVDGFDAGVVRRVNFGGDVKLGAFTDAVSFVAGFEGRCGIYKSTVHNCILGDNVYINNVGTLANYVIGYESIIANVSYLAVQGDSSFGNGTEVTVINESGGREVKIYDNLSAQIAYLMAVYRHRPKLIEKLNSMIDRYVESVTSTMGIIGPSSKVMNCGTLKNIKTGPNVIIEGANRLENGSINSTNEARVRIGANVIAKDFIVASGATVIDNVILEKCFVGQATELAKGYSAENSIFFANCGGYHGEACSIFAGPFTVTHHKATLLIAGMFSFFNAGSASNQSNHMYKLGPVQQAVFERGAKMGSGGYILCPARIGPFNAILGKHNSHPDTGDLPFSYILQSGDGTVILPAANLRSCGTLRDIQKWPKRDKREDGKLDHIIFEAFTPFTVERIYRAIDVLEGLLARSVERMEYVSYQDCKIKRSWLAPAIETYKLAIDRYLGEVLGKRLESGSSVDLLVQGDLSRWADLSGLIAPMGEVEKLCDDIEADETINVYSLAERFKKLYDNFESYQWLWVVDKIGDACHEDILGRGKVAADRLAEMLKEDAAKEFSETSMISYGLDDPSVRAEDFKAVRGQLHDNSFVKSLGQ